MKKILFILVLIITALMGLAQIDDELSEAAVNLVERVQVGGESDSYLYLSGIFASEKENPTVVGKKLLEELRKREADATYQVVEYEASKKIPLPKGRAFCKAWEAGCLSWLFSSEIDVESLLNDNEVLINRSNKFLEFEEYKTLTKPIISEQIAPYQYISAAERIKVLNAISSYKAGNPEEAIESLLSQFSTLRQSLALQDNLIGKLIFLVQLSEIMDVASIILSQEGIKIDRIPSLSPSEKSFYMVVAREFGMSYDTFKSLDKHPNFFEMGTNSPGWIARIVFKPNMTINAIAPTYYRLERLAQLPPSEFSHEIENGNYIRPSTSKIRNYVGEILIGVSSPDFDKHVASFTNFDAKLAIFNQVHSSSSASDGLFNLYDANDVPKEVNGSICFNSPLEDKRNTRCLKVKI